MARKRWPKGTWMKLKSPDILRGLMESQRFSHQRLADYAKCHRSMISQMVNAKNPKLTCSDDLGERIAEALSVPVTILFDVHESSGRGRNDGNKRKDLAA